MPWIPWLPITIMIGLLAWAAGDLQADFASRQLYIRAGFLVAALGLTFGFDDPAATTTDSVPSPLRVRRSLRALLYLIPWALLVAGFLWATAFDAPDRVSVPLGRLLLEAATLATWGLAIASVVAKHWDDEPGKIASPSLLVMYAASWIVPDRWKPWATPNDPRWETALPWWWVALGLAAIVAVTSSWDTRRRRLANFNSHSKTDTGLPTANSERSGRDLHVASENPR